MDLDLHIFHNITVIQLRIFGLFLNLHLDAQKMKIWWRHIRPHVRHPDFWQWGCSMISWQKDFFFHNKEFTDRTLRAVMLACLDNQKPIPTSLDGAMSFFRIIDFIGNKIKKNVTLKLSQGEKEGLTQVLLILLYAGKVCVKSMEQRNLKHKAPSAGQVSGS